MRTVSYAEFKALLQANPTWERCHSETSETNAVVAYSGTAEHHVRALAKNYDAGKRGDGVPAGTDFDDWSTNFSAGSTLVSGDDEAAFKILRHHLPSLAYPVDAGTGAPIVAIEQSAGAIIAPEVWPVTNLSLNSSTWKVAWSVAGSGEFAIALFVVNSAKIRFRVVRDGTPLFEANLDDLSDYDLDYSGGGSGSDAVAATVVDWELVEYANKKWRYRPVKPISFSTSISFEFKSVSGSKKVVRGMSSWGST